MRSSCRCSLRYRTVAKPRNLALESHLQLMPSSYALILKASLGFSPSDILAIVNIAWSAYRKCKTVSEEYAGLDGEVQSIHIVLYLPFLCG